VGRAGTGSTRERGESGRGAAGGGEEGAAHARAVRGTVAGRGFAAWWWRWPAFALAKIAAVDARHGSAYDAALARTLEHLSARDTEDAAARIDGYDAMASLAWMLVEAGAVEDAARVYACAKDALEADDEAWCALSEAREAGAVVERGWTMIAAVAMGAALGTAPVLEV